VANARNLRLISENDQKSDEVDAFLLADLGRTNVGVEGGDSEIEVIEGHRVGLLLDSKEALADAEDMGCRRMLLEGHPKEFLVELGRTLDVGDAHGHVVQGDGAEARWFWSGLGAGDQRGEGSGELTAGQPTAFEVCEHFLDDELHAYLRLSEIVLESELNLWRLLALVEVIVPKFACGGTFELPQPVAALPNCT
jgi:hypothetical protein